MLLWQMSAATRDALEAAAPGRYAMEVRGDVDIKGKGVMTLHWLTVCVSARERDLYIEKKREGEGRREGRGGRAGTGKRVGGREGGRGGKGGGREGVGEGGRTCGIEV